MPDKKLIIQIAIGATAAGLLYWWLQKSGLWAQMFSPNTFSDPSKLLAYCQSNPQGQAIFIDQAGQQHTAACSRWLLVNGSTPAPITETDNFSTPVDPALLSALQNAALSNPALGQDLGNIDQWNLLLQSVDPTAESGDLTHLGVSTTDMMTAQQFLMLRVKAGLNSLAPQEQTSETPYAWTN
jgi:hypothetical protein